LTRLRLPAALLGLVALASACGAPADNASQSSGPVATVAWQHDNVKLSHPADWQSIPFEPARHTNRFDVLGYLSSVPIDANQVCGARANANRCDFGAYDLVPGGVVVTITDGDSLAADVWQDEAPPDAEPTTIGGMPALASEELTDDGNLHLQWTVARPGAAGSWLALSAEVRPPGEEGARQQLAALIASVAFIPPPEPVADENSVLDQVAANALQQLRASRKQRPTYECFPDRPGARPGVVDRLPGTKRLTEPLPVNCSMRADATRWNLYRVRFRFAWADMAGRSAGSYLITQWLTADGELDASLAEGDSP
jgi:hypothetical protein